MAKVRRVDFSPDEWLAGTMSLDNAERGLYITACALIYSHGGPVPIDELKARSVDHGNSFNRQLRRLVALGKLVRNGSEITNKRCENELEKAGKRAEKGRDMAGQRWNNNGLGGGKAIQSSNGNLQPSTNNHQLNGISKNGVRGAADLSESPWEQRCRGWAKNGFWQPLWGPKPGEKGCGAPVELVAEVLSQRNGMMQ